MRSEGVTFQIAKKPLSPTTKAACYDNKGQENANAQRSLLKATEINCFLFFFFLSKNSLQTRNNEGNRGQEEKKNIFIEYSLTGA